MTITRTILLPALAAGLLAACLAPARAQAPDPAAAEREYRVARRLAADGSPEAGAALARVVALDPAGVVADDALLEQALLEGLPAWPDAMGAIPEAGLRRAVPLLERVVGTLSASDRAPEARYRLALARLEPLAGRDPAKARAEFLALAASRVDGPWPLAARHALGWIDEQDGALERALGAYRRIVVDHPWTQAAARAGMGEGRVLARQGAFGPAAAALQDALDGASGTHPAAVALREAAVRNLRRAAFAGARWPAAPPSTWASGIKSALAAVALPAGEVLVADRRAGAVVRFDAAGRESGRVALDELQALAVDPYGRAWVAAGERVFVLRGDQAVPVANQGAFAPAGSLAVDAAGRIYLTDRRGDRVGRVAPGAASPELLRERRGAAIAAIAWSGGRLLALEERTGRVIDVRPDGTDQIVGTVPTTSATSLVVDAAGQVAVLDARGGSVSLLGPDGQPRDRLMLEAAGVGRAAALSFGPDGSLDVFDASGAVARFP